MSDVERDPGAALYGGTVAPVAEPEFVLLPGHDVPLGRYTTVRRLLPQRPRRMIGAWCFVDLFGPDNLLDRPGMQVPPHPHTGLQTVTWLVEGEILHRDSLGNVQSIVPGQLNLMTSGHGIAHSEHSPPQRPPIMHGLQLWVALPEAARDGEAAFDHYPAMPVVTDGAAAITVVAGEFGSVRSPARFHTPLVGVEVCFSGAGGGAAHLPLQREFEYGVLVMSGSAEVAGVRLTPGSLLYLERGRTEAAVRADGPARLFLIGGEPFDDPLVMWWNFVGRSHEEIVAAREDWMAGRRFGTVADAGEPLPAPELPTVRLKARDRHGRIL